LIRVAGIGIRGRMRLRAGSCDWPQTPAWARGHLARLAVSSPDSSWSIEYEEISSEDEVCAHHYPGSLRGGRRVGTNKEEQK
jgi:hypothetical protein